jgi:hypothetical protein
MTKINSVSGLWTIYDSKRSTWEGGGVFGVLFFFILYVILLYRGITDCILILYHRSSCIVQRDNGIVMEMRVR